ncbi:MAG: hypothetical protein PHV06_01165 [bacterium]|nr:hypothetical protein [bacterium]
MLIRWATEKEREANGFDNDVYGPYDVLIAVDRMTKQCLGIAAFSREEKRVLKFDILDQTRKLVIEEKLRRCVNNQITQQGGSFHFRFPEYAIQVQPKFCPCCNNASMPEGNVDVAELPNSWVITSPLAQGKLFGKSVVVAKYHSEYFYDMPEREFIGYVKDVKRAAKALHKITEAVKINYEIHGNSSPHLHCHLYPRYLDDDFPSAPIDYRITEPSPYEGEQEFLWFVDKMRKELK